MTNVAKNTINQSAKGARNLDLAYNEQIIVVKVVKASASGDNALAFALLTANKKLLPLLYIWSNITAYKGGIRK